MVKERCRPAISTASPGSFGRAPDKSSLSKSAFPEPMDNGLYLALQAQRVLQRRLETAANNMANVTTAGFKADIVLQEETNVRPARDSERPHDLRFVRDVGVARDFAAGPLQTTGNPLDLAIQGEGFFVVQGTNGPLYTRDGTFALSANGTLVTQDGSPVLNQGGAPIVLDPRGERPEIGPNGAIRVGGVEVGRIGLVSFAEPGRLAKVGDNRFDAGDEAPVAAEGAIVQGAIERSNVNAVTQLTQLLEISRAYESASRVVRQGDELRQRAVERLGRQS